MGFFSGTPRKFEQISTLRPDQMPLSQQAINAGLRPGAGGAFGTSADYYRDLLSDDSNTYKAMQAPQMRQFNEDIIPGISEQFAGMGSGGLNSSGFRNAAVNAGTDLSERLGSIRAQLRQQGAQGLQGIGQSGLQSFTENISHEPTEGALDSLMPAITAGATSLLGPGGTALGFLGNMGANWLSQSRKGKSDPYGKLGAGSNAAMSATGRR